MRELQEETGLVASAIGELGVFSDPKRDPRERVITIAFYALVKPSEVEGGDDAASGAAEAGGRAARFDAEHAAKALARNLVDALGIGVALAHEVHDGLEGLAAQQIDG